jgi:hypothetical protein
MSLQGKVSLPLVSCRVLLDAYLAFATEVNNSMEIADDPEDLNWNKIAHSTIVEPFSMYCWLGVQDWISEGIR